MSDDTEEKGHSRTLILMVFSAAIGGTLQYGYNIAIINAPTVYIQRFINETCLERWGVALSFYQVTLIWTLVVSAFSLGGLAGALMGGPMAVFFGRKQALLLNNVFLIASTVLVLTCQVAGSFEMIVLSRFLVGVNSGVSMNVQPMYFGESAPKKLRGLVALSSAVFTALGILLGQVVGLTDVLGSEPHWPYLLASNAIPGLVQLLALPWFPESPRYLLIDRDDPEACARALRRLRGRAVPGAEMEEMLQEREQVAAGRGTRARRPWELFSDRALRWQLLSIVVTSSAMQLCGNDSIYFYAYYVFQEAGISASQIQYVTIGTGACELLSSLTCSLLIERLGRRWLLVGGYALMATWALVFTLALSLQGTMPGMPYLSMACVFAYILSFGMGPAGVSVILPAEVFGQTARPAAYMIAGSLMWLNLFLVGMAFPFVVGGLGSFCFLPFCAVCLLASFFVGAVLPETKGKSLQEITSDFDQLNSRAQGGREPVSMQA
ncbi:solute carrier family 2, facilitated glucose transporter member 11-like [Scleropages formosus]|uniref:Solute carrier family 2, facilitated glucose transporter member 5 n=1 Tax=Scleropages formosus TaxID=113540 RepID=A0A0P7TBF5_SCLFO|nr:solute carrier family 2, facilitated glucose transporter member 11-like [Scleropages formosus]